MCPAPELARVDEGDGGAVSGGGEQLGDGVGVGARGGVSDDGEGSTAGGGS